MSIEKYKLCELRLIFYYIGSKFELRINQNHIDFIGTLKNNLCEIHENYLKII